jgi:hypothetical protein
MPTDKLRVALLAILAEVEPDHLHHDADSYLPPHLIAQARQALEDDAREQVRRISSSDSAATLPNTSL